MSAIHPVITVENIAKVYRIGVKEKMHDSLAGAVTDFIRNPLKNYRTYRSLYTFDDVTPGVQAGSPDVIWALKGVSFKVEEGEILGIIGINGAGKSTLLKILSRITPPTLGRAEIRGRVVSLLEVGTGFHRELTGRENVYLNGTILGMTKREVDRTFDEIVDFSGVEKFLDTPVKRYSSGMRVRLAFAVAAHLEPEILIIDEVLAVGDAAFQKKCLGKMSDVAKGGRTVLFVSHNMGAITQLCQNAIWLEQGQVKNSGSSRDMVASYLSAGAGNCAVWENKVGAGEGKEVITKSARILPDHDQPGTAVDFEKPFRLEVVYEIVEPIRNLSIVCQVLDPLGNYGFETMDTDTTALRGTIRQPGTYRSVCNFPSHLLKPGRYFLTVVSLIDRIKIIELHENILTLDVTEVGYSLTTDRYGYITPLLDWQVDRLDT